MEVALFKDILVIFSLAIGVLLICQRLKLPTVVGFLFTGILAGPYGFGLISAIGEVEVLAEIGVMLLLFTIGVEFSLKEFMRMKKSVILGGSLQVVLTFLVSFAISTRLGRPFNEAVFIGFFISLSSTAVVLKILQEKAEFDSPHGRTALAILIFQDIAVVPMILFTPLLAGEAAHLGKSLGFLALKGVGVFALVAVSARWIVPGLLYQIARSRSRELFLLSVLVMCFGVAWLTYLAGLSLALGAFLAGLIISESEYGYHALGNIVPFRDVFTSLFFVSIGMLLDLGFLMNHPDKVALISGAVIISKTLIATIAVLFLGFPLRTAIVVGLTLCQVGEFSFILAKVGVDYGLLVGDTFQLFLAVAVITMGVTPFIMALAPRVANATLGLPLPVKLKTGFSSKSESASEHQAHELEDHLIIVGYGLSGKNVATAAKTAKIPYVIIEMNPETVRNEKKAGKLNPKIHIIARTRFFAETIALRELGANEVIADEYETSVEIFARVLAKYLVPKEEIDLFTAETRKSGYQMFRKPMRDPASLADLKVNFPDMEISSIRVHENSPVAGRSLADLQLRTKYGVNLLAIRRGPQILSNPDGQSQILGDDILILLGSPSNLVRIAGPCLKCEG
jgi:CPA2 family monovalent cation:H+ antiporter-2